MNRIRKIGRKYEDNRSHVEISLAGGGVSHDQLQQATISVRKALLAGEKVTRHVTKGRLRVA